MKISQYWAAPVITIFLLLQALAPSALAQSPFMPASVNTGSNHTLNISATAVVEGYTFALGDVIGVFTPGGICAGVAPWTSANISVVAWGNNSAVPQDTVGFLSGQPFQIRIWQASTNTIRVADSLGLAPISFSGLTFENNGATFLSYLRVSSQTLPVLSLSYSTTAICSGTALQFTLTSSGAMPDSIIWDFRQDSPSLGGTSTAFSPFQTGGATASRIIQDTMIVRTRTFTNGIPTHLRTGKLRTVVRQIPQLSLSTTAIVGSSGQVTAQLLNITSGTITWNVVGGSITGGQYTTQATFLMNATGTISATVEYPECSFSTQAQVLQMTSLAATVQPSSLEVEVGSSTTAQLTVNFEGITQDIVIISAVSGLSPTNVTISVAATSPHIITYTYGPSAAAQTTALLTVQHGTQVITTTLQLTARPAVPQLLLPTNGAALPSSVATLTWTEAAGSDMYEVQISTSADFSSVETYSSTSTTISLERLNDRTYYWRVRGIAAGISGNFSGSRSFSTPPLVRAAPVLIQPAAGILIQTLQPTFVWSGVASALSYDLEITGGGNVISINTTLTTFQINEILQFSTAYEWRVRGRNQVGPGQWSATRQFFTPEPPPAPPFIIAPLAGAVGVPVPPRFRWQSINSPGARYHIQVSTEATFSSLLDEANEIMGTEYISTSATYQPLAEYYWRIRASNLGGQGEWSTAADFRIQGLPPTLIAPADSAIGIGASIAFEWSTAATSTSAVLYIAQDANFESVIFMSEETAGSTATFSGVLLPNSDYFWLVAGKSTFGDTARSATRRFRSRLAAPALLQPLSGASNVDIEPILRWRTVAGADTYTLRIQIAGQESVFSLADTVFQAPGLPRGTSIQWSVQASNSEGNSSPLASALFTTKGILEDVPFAFNGAVHALQYAGGDSLFVGGAFTAVGKPASGIAAIDTATATSPFALPAIEGTVHTIIGDGEGGYFIGGEFSSVGGFARSNVARLTAGGGLHPWSPNINGTVHALSLAGGKLFVGGNFSSVNTTPAGGLAIFSAAGDLLRGVPTNGAVFALLADENRLYIGGSFTFFDGIGRNYLAVINPANEQLLPLGTNANGTIRALAVSPNRLYLGGDFTTINNTPMPHLVGLEKSTVALLSTWQASNLTGSVRALAFGSNRLFVGGEFTGFLRAFDGLNGMRFAAYQPSLNGAVYSLTAQGLQIFAGGAFTQVQGQVRRYATALSTFDGSLQQWNPRFGDTVRVLRNIGGIFMAGGNFRFIDAQERAGVALLNMGTKMLLPWSPSVQGKVNALALTQTSIAVGGDFTVVNNQPRGRLAFFNRATGSLLSGTATFDSTITALTPSWENVAVGGQFTRGDAQPRAHLALVSSDNGVLLTWRADADGDVHALLSNDTALYVGGSFAFINNQPRSRLARLSPQTAALAAWAPAADGAVSSLAFSADGNILAGGDFTQIASVGSQKLALLDRSNGTLRTAFAPANQSIQALSVLENVITAGGNFTNIGASSRQSIATLNDDDGTLRPWQISLNGEVKALAARRGALVIGGDFTTADGVNAPYLILVQQDIDTLSAPILVAPEQFAEELPLTVELIWRRVRAAGSYHLQIDTVPTLAGATNVTLGRDTLYMAEGLKANTSYYWRVRATNSLDTSRWSEVRAFSTRECEDSLGIVSAPRDTAVCAGATLTFAVVATGNSLTYQWERNGTTIAGATAATLQIIPSEAGSESSYSVAIRNICGDIIRTTAARVEVLQNPQILQQPISQEVCIGSPVTFTTDVTPAGTPLQWYKNGAPIAGATTTTLTIATTASADAGAYKAIFVSPCGDVIETTAATLVVDDNLPRILSFRTDPPAAALCAGEDVRIVVEAEGRGLVFTWRRDGEIIPGVTSSTIVLPSVGMDESGVYQVTVSVSVRNVCDQEAESEPLELTILERAKITSQPTAQPVYCQGDSLVLTATAEGTNVSYAWLKDGLPIAGAASSTLRRPSLAAADAGVYRLIVSGDCNSSDTSAPLIINVAPSTQISLQPRDTTVLQDSVVIMSVSAAGVGLRYQWQRNGLNLTEETEFRGVAEPTLRILRADTTMNGTYRCVVSGDCGLATSDGATLTVIPRSADFSYVVTPQRLDFERVNVGQSRRLSLTIRNTGVEELVFTNITISGENAADFTIEPPTNFTIPVGTVEVFVDVNFRPTSGGAKNALLRLFSNAVQDFTITLSGEGVSNQPQPGQFVQMFDLDGTTPLDTLIFEEVYDPSRDVDKEFFLRNITGETIIIDTVEFVVQRPEPPRPTVMNFSPFPTNNITPNGFSRVDIMLRRVSGLIQERYMAGIIRVHVRNRGIDEFPMRAGQVPNSINERELVRSSGQIFPNPNEGRSQLTFNSEAGRSYTVEVFTDLGSKIYEAKGLTSSEQTRHSIHLENVASGMYRAVVSIEGKVAVILPIIIVR